MVKKGNLFLLIKSLTKSEKRYVKLYAAIGKDGANYLRLFDAIDGQAEYDEAAIIQQFDGEPFTRQLHVTKIYLSKFIMKALRNFHAGTSVNATILDMLRDVELLFDKELYTHCLQKIDKAEQLCRRYEKLPLLASVLGWKRKLLLAQSAPVAGVTQLVAQEQENTARLAELNNYWSKTLDIYSSREDAAYIQEIVKGKPGTLQAKVLRCHMLYTWYFLNGKPAKAEKELAALISLLEEDEKRIGDDPSSYVTAISNRIGMYLGQHRWADIPPLLQKMRDVPVKYKLSAESKFTVRLWLRLYNLELELYRDMKDPAGAVAIIAEVGRYQEAHSGVIPGNYRIMLAYQVAALYFIKKDYPAALGKVNEIIHHNFGDTRTDLQCYARILNMLIHFELGNITVLRYAVHNCRRFFAKIKAGTPFNKNILQMFSSLSLARKEEYPAIIKKYLDVCFADDDSPVVQDYIDIRSWMESKLVKSRRV